MIFEYFTSVRGYELDSYNHLNNAVYLNYLEEARWQIFKKLDLFCYFKETGLLLVVTEVNIKYSREARLFDELVVKTEVKAENPYIIFMQKIYNKNTGLKLSTAKVKTILIDREKTPVDIPEELLKINI